MFTRRRNCIISEASVAFFFFCSFCTKVLFLLVYIDFETESRLQHRPKQVTPLILVMFMLTKCKTLLLFVHLSVGKECIFFTLCLRYIYIYVCVVAVYASSYFA